MIKIVRSSFIALIALLPGLLASGQVKFTTVINSSEIGRGEYLQIEFVVENAKQIDQLNPPDFPGFRVVQGPIQSSGISVVNGNMSQYKALSFVLQPTKTGKFTIGGAAAVVDGKPMRSNSVTMIVNASAGSGTGGNNPPNGGVSPNVFPQLNWPDPSGGEPTDIEREYILRPGENIKEKIRKNLFVKVQVDKTNCYVGEPIVATYKLYSRLSSESRVTKRPSLNGFSVYDMIDPSSDAVSIEKVNGRPFTVHIIRKTQLIPLQAGIIDLDPVEVENTVHFVKGNRQERTSGNSLRDLFDRLSDDNASGPELEENVVLDTKPLAITIKPLPEENKPADYNGAVGNFSIQASLNNNKNITAQDEATLKVVVKGGGNLPVINAPSVPWPAGIQAYEPTAKEDLNKATVPMSGSKSFEYVFSPRTPGQYTIPPIPFCYFDPASHSYKKVQSAPIDFQVNAAEKKAPPISRPALASSVGSENAGVKNFIQQHLESVFIVLILSCLAFYLLRQNLRMKAVEKRQQAELSRQTATKQAALNQAASEKALSSHPAIIADPLQDVRGLLENGDYKGFYRELNRAVWKAVSAKLELPASELNKSNIARQLQAGGWDADTTRSLQNLLNECEMNLYTPAYDPYNMQQLLRQAETLFRVLVANSSY